jgi:hypothetical protein
MAINVIDELHLLLYALETIYFHAIKRILGEGGGREGREKERERKEGLSFK